MKSRPVSEGTFRSPLLPVATAAAALAIFAADVFTPPDCVVSGLYVVVVLMAGNFLRDRRLWFASLGCAALAVGAQFLAHRYVLENNQVAYIGAFNTLVSIVAIVLSTYLVVRGFAAQAALHRARIDLAYAGRVTLMGELTASIAHEVNQPIVGVVTNASACLRWLGGESPNLQEAQAAASRIVRDGRRAADIISRVRQLFTKGTPQRQPVDINQLIRETVELLGAQAARESTTIRTDLVADLPFVMADRIQLQQVVLNLILNGVDAMKESGTARELTVRSGRSEEGHVAVSVADNGVGLPPQDVHRLFDPFFTTKPEGTGMGLSISRSIIEAHDGRLWATPNRPRGAVFAFALPAGEPGMDPFPPTA
ncbi:MAG TPA: ATP-binding protein [Rhizomicrobium sp.]|jgi:signal transduction histidine kinase|nr:ATP-binding protein [Rhizomicrobium sp.]